MGRQFGKFTNLTTVRRTAFFVLALGIAFMIGRSSTSFQDRRYPQIDTTLEAEKPVTRLYDVSDIVSKAANFLMQRAGEKIETVGQPQNHSPDWAKASQQPTRWEVEDHLRDALQDAIIETVAQESWKSHGGIYGSLRYLGADLLITQTPEVHRQIEQFLILLRSPPLASSHAVPQLGEERRVKPPSSQDSEHAYVVVYDVHDIIEQAADQAVADFNSGPPRDDGHNRWPDGIYADDGRVEVLFRLTSTLTDSIVAIVLPETWDLNGGNMGRLRVFGHHIIISQSCEAHAQIERLLAEFRKHPRESYIRAATQEAN
jgi:hypothetical protein